MELNITFIKISIPIFVKNYLKYFSITKIETTILSRNKMLKLTMLLSMFLRII